MKPSSGPLRVLCLLAALASCDGEDNEHGEGGETHEEDESHAGDAGDAQSDSADDAGAANSDDASTAGSSGGTSDGGASSGGGARSDAGNARDGGAVSDAGSKDAGSTNKDGGAPGRTCGGFAALECSGKQFCNYEPPSGQGCDGQVSDAAGVCETLPDTCTEPYEPVCGCDNRTYSNSCEAHRAGVSVAKTGACAVKGTSCDRRPLTCRRAEPLCPEGQVVAIVGNCFGDCVPIEQCACSEADACPQPEKYTCHRSAMHCGPYVN